MAIIYHVVNLFKPIIVIFYDMKSILERYFFRGYFSLPFSFSYNFHIIEKNNYGLE